MVEIKFFKLNNPPAVWVPNSEYFIKENDYVSHYVTDADGNPKSVSNQVNADWDATEGIAKILNKPVQIGSFTFIQGVLTQDWVIDYPDPYIGFPHVSIIDTLGRGILILPKYNSDKQLELNFGRPTIGIAFLKF